MQSKALEVFLATCKPSLKTFRAEHFAFGISSFGMLDIRNSSSLVSSIPKTAVKLEAH